MDENCILLKDVSKTYSNGRLDVTALSDVGFSLPCGTSLSLCGPSGSGKTTLLNLIGGLDRPDSGDILVNGKSLLPMTEKELTLYRRKSVGFIFQDDALIPDMTVYENVELPLVLSAVASHERLRRVKAVLAELQMSDRLRSYPDELSGGERQRISVARAIVHGPSILLADEPTSNLDKAASVMVLEAIRGLAAAKGISLVLSSHDESVLSRFDRRLTLSYGRIT